MAILSALLLGSSAFYVPSGPAVRRSAVSMVERTPLIAGNWKMNTNLEEAVALAKDVAAASATAPNVDVAVCVPYPFLVPVYRAINGSRVGLGAQDAYYADAGAYTAAVSTSMLKSVGSQYVLSGHSERRATFGDSDEEVNKKTLKIIDEGLTCILCVGELKEERESGKTFDVCATQLSKGLKGVSAEMMKHIVIAYEPVWAIGTGLTATPEIAQETHAYIRSWFVENYSQEVADAVILQYGGSVSPANVDDLMACEDIDGALVGGASLQADSFGPIINFKRAAAAATAAATKTWQVGKWVNGRWVPKAAADPMAVDDAVLSDPIFLNEAAALSAANFALPPEQLIKLAKRFLASKGGFGADAELLSDDFQFVGPVVGPLSKSAFLAAIGSVDVQAGFPDFNPQFSMFQVDPIEGNRVWYVARGRGTNTGPFPPFSSSPTGKELVNPPQACSLTFAADGLVTKYTIGVVMDRQVGNTGGLGGLYGILYAIGKPLPFPEAQPWKISKRYRLFQALGNLASRAAKK